MSGKICPNGHTFEKTSSCPVCPICSKQAMETKFGEEFPKIGAPALRALDTLGVTKLSQLTKHSQKELLALHGFGPRALQMLNEALKEKGQSFAQNESSS